ncbi:MAG TPA: hypothetical protein VMQ50_06415 [Casimicrobiaceae bacterium]|nr:hypothetical protein [Casimicrobiaceae bacterium]
MSKDAQQTASDDWLEQALRADAREHLSVYLPDDGFTARVVSRLPQPALPAWRRPVLALLWVVAGIAIAAALPTWFDEVFGSVAALVLHRFTLSDAAVALTLLFAATSGALVLAARAD